jgi:altronate dehydratase small subunit
MGILNMLDAIVVNSKDNIATSIRLLRKNEKVRLSCGTRTVNISLTEEIPFGHKFAMDDIEEGNPVIKYGERIGLATRKIYQGQLVHVHNVEGTRGRGDKSGV